VLTSLLGSPVDNWQYLARQGGAIFIVGILVVGIYLWVAIREHLFSARRSGLATEAEKKLEATKPAPMPALPETTGVVVTSLETALERSEAAPPAPTIEDILDELQAGKITRNEAASSIRSLLGPVT